MYSNSITIVAGVPPVIEVCGYENSMCIIKIFWSYFANTFECHFITYIKKEIERKNLLQYKYKQAPYQGVISAIKA
jgi:hypothetical protein